MMRAKHIWVGLCVAAVAIGVRSVHAGGEHGEHKGHRGDLEAVKCPVMGEPVNLAVSTETDDGPVYFCCKSCIKKFNKEPEKFATAVAEQRKALAKLPKVQVTCPISGKPVNGKSYAEVDGKKIYTCCPMCVEKYERHPEEYKAALAGAYTYQTKCPITGEDISPKAFTELASGQKVYYCCPGCAKKLLADPASAVEKLAAQGYRFKPEQIKAKGG